MRKIGTRRARVFNSTNYEPEDMSQIVWAHLSPIGRPSSVASLGLGLWCGPPFASWIKAGGVAIVLSDIRIAGDMDAGSGASEA